MPRLTTPADLPRALLRFKGLTTLSLACFDTLLWRDCHSLAHLFTRLPHCTLHQRVQAERQARRVARQLRGTNAVSLPEIYAELLPNASQYQREEAIAAELALEARHCFAFAPIVDFMRQARAAGLQIILVSDTYCSVAQLRKLLARAGGVEIAGLINAIFCSSQSGRSKADGLFDDVVAKRNLAPHTILHIGDNLRADYEGAQRAGINALHFQQFADPAPKRLQLEARLAPMARGKGGDSPDGAQPHRPVLALAEPQSPGGAHAVGLASLGPMFHTFETWLQREAQALAKAHQAKVHWLFLMRDGHLPRIVHEASGGHGQNSHCANNHVANSHAAEISRFTARAASFSMPGAIQRYGERALKRDPLSLARQLLFSEEEIARLALARKKRHGREAVLADIRQPARQQQLRARGEGFATRLITHVRQLCRPSRGDVLMLVDLGYNGTVQNRIDGLLKDRLGVHVAGRYLLLRENNCPGLDKAGLFSSATHDANLLDAMYANIAVLEQFSTADIGAAIDYEDDGTPIRRANPLSQRQCLVRSHVQEGIIDFVEAARSAPALRAAQDGELQDDFPLWRDAASSALLRLMVLSLPDEMRIMGHFKRDDYRRDKGTSTLFDRAAAEKGLRDSGFYAIKNTQRMYLPA